MSSGTLVYNLREDRLYKVFKKPSFLQDILVLLKQRGFEMKDKDYGSQWFIKAEKKGTHLNFKPSLTMNFIQQQNGWLISTHYYGRLRKSGVAAAIGTVGITALIGVAAYSIHVSDAKDWLADLLKAIDFLSVEPGLVMYREGFDDSQEAPGNSTTPQYQGNPQQVPNPQQQNYASQQAGYQTQIYDPKQPNYYPPQKTASQPNMYNPYQQQAQWQNLGYAQSQPIGHQGGYNMPQTYQQNLQPGYQQGYYPQNAQYGNYPQNYPVQPQNSQGNLQAQNSQGNLQHAQYQNLQPQNSQGNFQQQNPQGNLQHAQYQNLQQPQNSQGNLQAQHSQGNSQQPQNSQQNLQPQISQGSFQQQNSQGNLDAKKTDRKNVQSIMLLEKDKNTMDNLILEFQNLKTKRISEEISKNNERSLELEKEKLIAYSKEVSNALQRLDNSIQKNDFDTLHSATQSLVSETENILDAAKNAQSLAADDDSSENLAAAANDVAVLLKKLLTSTLETAQNPGDADKKDDYSITELSMDSALMNLEDAINTLG